MTYINKEKTINTLKEKLYDFNFESIIDSLPTANDVTEKYGNMISAFQCDLSLARDGAYSLVKMDMKNKHINKDIDLLEELEFGLRHGILKIISSVID